VAYATEAELRKRPQGDQLKRSAPGTDARRTLSVEDIIGPVAATAPDPFGINVDAAEGHKQKITGEVVAQLRRYLLEFSPSNSDAVSSFPLRFWPTHQQEFQLLADPLARGFCTIPHSQVRVESLFRILGYITEDRRSRLSVKVADDITYIHANHPDRRAAAAPRKPSQAFRNQKIVLPEDQQQHNAAVAGAVIAAKRRLEAVLAGEEVFGNLELRDLRDPTVLQSALVENKLIREYQIGASGFAELPNDYLDPLFDLDDKFFQVTARREVLLEPDDLDPDSPFYQDLAEFLNFQNE